jgi:DNA-binding CsgD family transcriptional regulator
MSFKERFNHTNPKFLENLLSKHPFLTQTEITICMFLKLNYSSTDISKNLNVSKSSVDNYRYNIRKKIGLDKKMSMVSYLNTI